MLKFQILHKIRIKAHYNKPSPLDGCWNNVHSLPCFAGNDLANGVYFLHLDTLHFPQEQTYPSVKNERLTSVWGL